MNDPEQDPAPAAPATPAAAEILLTPSRFKLPVRWQWLGFSGVCLWMLLFSAGVLIDSSPYRGKLGWESAGKASEIAQKNSVQDTRLWQLENPGKPIPDSLKPVLSGGDAHGTPEKLMPGKFACFIIAMFTYLPLNIAFLCILAAYIGGCSVNKHEVAQIEDQIFALAPNDSSSHAEKLKRQLSYLTTDPVYSIMRGLVVYLVLVSGQFLLGGSPITMEESQVLGMMQYIRLAGMFSFAGYIVGHDPTAFFSIVDFSSSRLRKQQPDASGK